MTRLAIIIGLGGTGQRIVTYLKKELLELGNGELPEDVKLLAFDTVSRTARGGAGDEDGVFRLGNVCLEENTEYVCMEKDLYNTVYAIAADQRRVAVGQAAQNPHLLWFPAKEMLERCLPRAAYKTTLGTGALRPVGRLSLFENVPSVLTHLEEAMVPLQGRFHGGKGIIEIVVVGSMAGGTGAGTLVDMAWLVRTQADAILHDQYTLRGIFLLPTTFGIGVGSEHKQGRGFATWQELDRAMLSGGSGNTIVYDLADPNLHIKCDTPAYDITYMIDPGRPVHPIQPPPEDGIFPGVAHLLSFLLDEDSGRAYTENLITTIMDRRSTLPSGVYHSSIGGFTFKVPAYYNRAKFSHELARKALDVLLKPQMNSNGVIAGVSDLANLEAPDGTTGLKSALSFLGSDIVGAIPNTNLLRLIARHRMEKVREDRKLIQHIAGGGLRTSLLNYFKGLTQMTDYGEKIGQAVSHCFSDELNWALWKECLPRSQGEAPENAYKRLTLVQNPKSVPTVRERRFGVDDATHPTQGEFWSDLVKLQQAQVRRFKELLAEQIRQDLNGRSSDPLVARAGKLGYVRNLVHEVKESLAYFRGGLKDVHDVRNHEKNLSHVTRDAASRAKQKYAREYNKHCWSTFWDGNVHPKADRACRNWLQAEMFDIDRQRGDILLQVLDETVAEMEEYAKKTLVELESWIAHLATGDPSLEIEGLYRWVLKSHEAIEINHQLDKRQGNPNFHADQQLFGVMQVLLEDESEPTDEMLVDVLGRLQWKIEQGKDGFQIDLDLSFDSDNPEDSTEVVSLRRNGEKPVRYNLQQLICLSERHYATVAQASSIAYEIEGVFPTGQDLARSLHNRAEPYYRLQVEQLLPSIRQAWLRVDNTASTAMQAYFDVDFKGQYLSATPLVGLGGYQKLHSEDRYKLTLVRSDDLMPSQSFAQWHTCFAPYQKLFQVIGEKEVHVFPHEQNAAYYQQKIPEVLGKGFRVLHPEVVALLGNRRKFELFFKAIAHGLVAKELADENGSVVVFWCYKRAEHSTPLYLSVPSANRDGTGVFELIQNFLDGHDVRRDYEQTCSIDWSKLRTGVSELEQQLGQEQKRNLYKTQIENNPDTLLGKILAESSHNLNFAPAKQAAAINQKYADLADIANYIFKMAAS